MHDSNLMEKISSGVSEICDKASLKKISLMEIVVGMDSHITEESLLEHLIDLNGEFVDKYTKIDVTYEDIPELMAIIKKVEGEKR